MSIMRHFVFVRLLCLHIRANVLNMKCICSAGMASVILLKRQNFYNEGLINSLLSKCSQNKMVLQQILLHSTKASICCFSETGLKMVVFEDAVYGAEWIVLLYAQSLTSLTDRVYLQLHLHTLKTPPTFPKESLHRPPEQCPAVQPYQQSAKTINQTLVVHFKSDGSSNQWTCLKCESSGVVFTFLILSSLTSRPSIWSAENCQQRKN